VSRLIIGDVLPANACFNLQGLNPVKEAAYHSYDAKDTYNDAPRQPCFPNTHVEVLNEIQMWMKDVESESIYVLFGVAGIGKSTIAQSVAKIAADDNLLGASFFFSGDQEKRSTVRWLFPTLAYYLSCHHAELAARVGEALTTSPDIADRNLREQFESLIVEPLQTLPAGEPILLVLDAVDACEKTGAETILSLFAEYVAHIPRLKVFITARPEQHIAGVFRSHHPHKQFCLHDIKDKIVQDDIRLYIEHVLSKDQVRSKFPHVHLDWEPTHEEKDMLVEMSGKLFIIAATAAKFILDPQQMDPPKQLAILGPVRLPSFWEKTIFENLRVHLVPPHFAVNKINCRIPKWYRLGLVQSF